MSAQPAIRQPFRNAAHDLDADIGGKLSGCEIIEKEQGFRALDDEIVDAHRDKIDADRVMDIGIDRDLNLGADAVIRGDENRIYVTSGLEIEEPAEPANFGVGPRPACRAHQRLDLVDHSIAGIDADAGIRIGQAIGVVAHLSLRWRGVTREEDAPARGIALASSAAFVQAQARKPAKYWA